MAIERISAIVFPGGFNLPLWTAMAHGFLRARDIELDLAYTANSVEQLAGLITGKWDIGLTAFDNIVAYAEGQGEQPVEGEPDLFAFMGGDNGFLRLVVLPEMQTYADLRGKTLSVERDDHGLRVCSAQDAGAQWRERKRSDVRARGRRPAAIPGLASAQARGNPPRHPV
jgi:ABC-type nitrate/sulfonate/bicarbonate transport system substrate-binding protein